MRSAETPNKTLGCVDYHCYPAAWPLPKIGSKLKLLQMARCLAPILLCCSSVAACVPVVQTTDGRTLRATDERFRDYVGEVFRRQNAATVAVGEGFDRFQGAQLERLEESELSMIEACAALNDLGGGAA